MFFFIDSCYYYGGSGTAGTGGEILGVSETAEARSPLAATRANSGASAASPIGTASCMKVEPSSLLG